MRKSIQIQEKKSKKGEPRIEFKAVGSGAQMALSNVFDEYALKEEIRDKRDAKSVFKVLKDSLLYKNSCKVVPSMDSESFCSFKITDGVGGEFLLRFYYGISVNENKVQIGVKAPKLREGEKRYILTVSDADKSLLNLIEYIKTIADYGHSFEVVVDPNDKEYRKSFGIDGDGWDHIHDVVIEDGPVEED